MADEFRSQPAGPLCDLSGAEEMRESAVYSARIDISTVYGVKADAVVTVRGRGQVVFRVLHALADYYEER